jgi:hypothetical protein
MAAPVVVQGLPPAETFRAAVLSACSDALKHRRCVSSDDRDRAAATPTATATIAWPDGDDRHVRIVLERFDVSSGPQITRDTRFADEDPVIERWRTVGLVIAALVGESEFSADSTEAPERRSTLGLAGRTGDRAAGWVGLSAMVGPGLDDGSVRLGGSLQGGYAFRSSPFFLSAFLTYAVRPVGDRNIDVGWTTVALGGGARTALTRIDLELRFHGEVLLEYLRATSDAPGVVTGGGSRLTPGLRGGVDAVWPASGPLGLTLGFFVWSLPGGTAIQLDQRKLGSSRWLGYAGLLGAAWSFP